MSNLGESAFGEGAFGKGSFGGGDFAGAASTGSTDNTPTSMDNTPTDLPSIDLIASSLRADQADIDVYVRALTATVGDSLPPGMVEVDYERTMADRLAKRQGQAVALHIHLPDQDLTLRRGRRGQLEAEARRTVRDVVIARRSIEVDEWIQLLAAGITALASRNAVARQALSRLLEP